MGYKSKVRIATTRMGYDRVCDYVDGHTIEGWPSLLGREREPECFEEHGNCVAFGWNDIKWDDSFPDVRNVMDALDALGCEDIPYRLVRVGEDWDDVEVVGQDVELCLDVYPITDIETVRGEY